MSTSTNKHEPRSYRLTARSMNKDGSASEFCKKLLQLLIVVLQDLYPQNGPRERDRYHECVYHTWMNAKDRKTVENIFRETNNVRGPRIERISLK